MIDRGNAEWARKWIGKRLRKYTVLKSPYYWTNNVANLRNILEHYDELAKKAGYHYDDKG